MIMTYGQIWDQMPLSSDYINTCWTAHPAAVYSWGESMFSLFRYKDGGPTSETIYPCLLALPRVEIQTIPLKHHDSKKTSCICQASVWESMCGICPQVYNHVPVEGREGWGSCFLFGRQVDFQTVPHVLELAWYHQSSSSLQVCPQASFPVRTDTASRTGHPAVREPVLPVTGQPGYCCLEEFDSRTLLWLAQDETQGGFVLVFPFHQPSRIR